MRFFCTALLFLWVMSSLGCRHKYEVETDVGKMVRTTTWDRNLLDPEDTTGTVIKRVLCNPDKSVCSEDFDLSLTANDMRWVSISQEKKSPRYFDSESGLELLPDIDLKGMEFLFHSDTVAVEFNYSAWKKASGDIVFFKQHYTEKNVVLEQIGTFPASLVRSEIRQAEFSARNNSVALLWCDASCAITWIDPKSRVNSTEPLACNQRTFFYLLWIGERPQIRLLLYSKDYKPTECLDSNGQPMYPLMYRNKEAPAVRSKKQ